MQSIKAFENFKVHHLSKEGFQKFKEQGFLGPYTLFKENEAESFLKKLYANVPNCLLPSYGRHGVIIGVAELSKNSHILNKVTCILGEDVILWGSHIFKQKPCVKHSFHRDAEFTELEGVVIWLALKNVVSEETFSVVPGSHLFELSPQELKAQGVNINDYQTLEEAAKKINRESRLVNLKVRDGQYIIFDGRLWHGTKNTTAKHRFSISLRYSKPSVKVRIAKNGNLPNLSWCKSKPVCLLVHGQDKFHINKLIDIKDISKSKGLIRGLFFCFPVKLLRNITRRITLGVIKTYLI